MKIVVGLVALVAIVPVFSSGVWNYEEQGADWEGICETGTRQTPIDILKADVLEKTDSDELVVNLFGNPEHYVVENNGHTIKVTAKGEPHWLAVNGTERFEVLQYHFHAPSEHFFEGRQRELELHVVTSNGLEDEAHRLVVIGFTLSSDFFADDNPFLAKLIDIGLPVPGSPEEHTDHVLDIGTLFKAVPKDLTLVRYEGSLTTPPCSEIVTWFVFLEPLFVPREQLYFFIDAFDYEGTDGNYREIDSNKNQDPILSEVGFAVQAHGYDGNTAKPPNSPFAASVITMVMIIIAIST